MRTCSIHGCDGSVKARNLCAKHYQRDKRHSDTGVNYKYRMNRLMITDNSTYIPTHTSRFERQVLRELFCMGRHQGPLVPNDNEAWSVWGFEVIYDI